MRVILASASPRRKMILEEFGYSVLAMPSNYDENIINSVYSDYKVENCAYKKAIDIANSFDSDNIVVGADTVVVYGGKILGKPKDEEEAIKTLSMLSGKMHFVATSICVIYKKQVLKKTEKTYITFKRMMKNEIINYVQTMKPFDKAGSYGIQDEGFNFVREIRGDLNNVIGFPMKSFNILLGRLPI